MVAFSVLALAASLAGSAAAFSVTAPSSQIWWVARSQNTLAWSCKDSDAPTNFTILISNSNPAIIQAPLAFLAIETNADCSKSVTPEQVNQQPATGYRILLADIFNQTHVYAQSDEFEIKPLGSAYPTSSTTSGASATGSGGAPGASGSSQNGKNGAASLKTLGLGLTVGMAAGIAYLM